jgi:hypothetical protein
MVPELIPPSLRQPRRDSGRQDSRRRCAHSQAASGKCPGQHRPDHGKKRFTHPDLKFEFLTDPGPKPDEQVYNFKQLGVTAQELRYMAIPLSHRMTINYDDLSITLPEPEAFALHKLIVCCLRKKEEKAIKDTETARGMLMFFEGKTRHVKRIREIYDGFPKGWRKRVDDGLKKAGLPLP